MNKQGLKLFGVAVLLGGIFAPPVSASWVGSADYTELGLGTADSVGPFDTYDLSNGGVVLLEQTSGGADFQVGNTYQTSYQTYVTAHTLAGVHVLSEHLNVPDGYELTLVAQYTQRVVSADNQNKAAQFEIIDGTVSLYFDETPDYDFVGDSGFANGVPLFQGDIASGTGFFLSNPGIGATTVNMSLSEFQYNQDVYQPAILNGGQLVFTLQTNAANLLSGISSVLGNAVDGQDLLLAADGNLELTAIPVPGAVWLLGSGLMALVAAGRRRKLSCGG